MLPVCYIGYSHWLSAFHRVFTYALTLTYGGAFTFWAIITLGLLGLLVIVREGASAITGFLFYSYTSALGCFAFSVLIH